MKRYWIALLLALVLVSPALAIPQQIAIQGRLTNSTGGLEANKCFDFNFSIFASSSGGTLLYNETYDIESGCSTTASCTGIHSTTLQTTSEGVFNANLGTCNPINLPFDTDYYIEITVNDSTLSPRHTVTSAAYTFRSNITEYIADEGQVEGDLNVLNTVRTGAGSTAAAALGFIGDVHTGLYQVADNRLGFVTEGVRRAEANSTGFGVNGQLMVSSLASCDTIDTLSNGTLVCGSDATGAGESPHAFLISGSDAILNSSLSNVGIGAVTPGSPLHVNGSGELATFGDENFNDKYIQIRDDTANGVTLGLTDNNFGSTGGAGLIKTGSNKGFAILTDSTTNFPDVTTANFVIDTSGYVGINTSSPTQLLTVLGDANVTGNFSAGTGSAVLHVDDESNSVGIGTTTPETQFQVLGPASTSALIEVKGSGFTTGFRAERTSATAAVGILIAQSGNILIGSEDDVPVSLVQGNSAAISIDTSKRVGIGTTTPNNELEVVGTVNATAFIGDGSSLTNVGGGASPWNLSSGDVILNDTNANVGIGTTGPNAILQVGGDPADVTNPTASFADTTNGGKVLIRGLGPELIFDTTGGNSGKILIDSQSFDIYSGNSDSIGSSRLHINSSGNIGIGTISPEALLDIEANDNATLRLSSSDITMSGEAYGKIEFHSADTSRGPRVMSIIESVDPTTSGGQADIVFRTWDSTVSSQDPPEIARITGDGYVGIGTAIPHRNLEVTDTQPFILINGTGSDSEPGLRIQNDARQWLIYNAGGDSDKLYFRDATAGATRMVIDSSGRVGIGITGPSAKLEVRDTADGNIGIFRRVGATQNPGLEITASETDGTVGFDTIYSTTTPAIIFSQNSNERMRVHTDGNVGIGTTTPLTTLHVAGTTNSTQDIIVGSDAIVGGVVSLAGGSVSAPSLTFTAGTDTGLYRPAETDLAFSITGTQRLFLSENTARFRNGTASAPGLSFISDTNTGTYLVDDDVLGFGTGGSNALRIENNQAVNSTQSFVLSGLTNCDTLDTTSNGTIVCGSDAASASDHPWNISSSEVILNDTNTNVGIGTTNPSFGKLEVQTTSDPYFVVRDSTSTRIYQLGVDSTNGRLLNWARFGSGGHYPFGWAFGSTTNVLMELDSTGALTVNGSVTSQEFDAEASLIADSNDDNANLVLDAGGTGGDGDARILLREDGVNEWIISNDADAGDDLIFSDVTNNNLVLENGGQVGINTTNPIALLTLTGDASSKESGIRLQGPTGGGYLYYNDTADTLNWFTNSDNRFTIDTNGQVGINNTSPSYLLDVQGGFGHFSTDNQVDAGIGIQSGTQSRYWITSNEADGNYLKFTLGGTPGSTVDNALVLESTGDIGIGTASPDYALDVETTADAAHEIRINNPSSGSSAESGLRFRTSSSDASITLGIGAEGLIFAAEDGNIPFNFTTGSSENTRLFIESENNGGYVGINTSSPNVTLHVSSGDFGGADGNAISDLAVEDDSHVGIELNSPNNFFNSIYFRDEDDAGSTASGYIRYRHTLDDLWFRTNGQTRLVLDSSGNVNITGLTNCDTIDTDENGQLSCGTDSGGGGGSPWNQTGTDIYLNDTTSGRVGIGSTAPETKLEVSNTTDSLAEVARFGVNGNSGGDIGTAYIGLHHWTGTNQYPSTRIGAIETSAANYDAHLVFQTRSSDSDSEPTTKLIITDDGDVGIGATTPQTMLHVNGTNGITISNVGGNDDEILLQFTETNNYDEFQIIGDFAGAGVNNKLQFVTDLGGGDILTLKGDGKVGFNDDTPEFGLDIRNQDTTNEGMVYIGANLNSGGKGLVINSSTRTTGDNDVYALEIVNRAGTNTLAATVEGNVGIGTQDAPDYRLEVNSTHAGSSSERAVSIVRTPPDTGSTQDTGLTATASGASLSSGTATKFVGVAGSAVGPVSGGTVTTASGVEGTIFVVGGTATSARALYADTGTSFGGTIDTGYGLYIDTIDATTSYGVYQASSNNNNYFAGKVGINTSSPTQALTVNGDANVTGNFSAGTGSAVLHVDDQSNRVGILTSTPTSPLDVSGNISTSANISVGDVISFAEGRIEGKTGTISTIAVSTDFSLEGNTLVGSSTQTGSPTIRIGDPLYFVAERNITSIGDTIHISPDSSNELTVTDFGIEVKVTEDLGVGGDTFLTGDLHIDGEITRNPYDNLVFAYNFNGGHAAKDFSPNMYNGTISGATQVNSCPFQGDCYNFDGVNDQITTNSPTNTLSGDFTISAWINRSSGHSGPDAIYGQGSSFFFVEDTLRFQRGTGGFETIAWSGGTMAVNTWYHVAITHAGTAAGETKLFINGVNDDSGAAIPNLPSGTNRIGYSSSTRYWQGQIDDVRVFNRSLSPREINDIYYDGVLYNSLG